MSPSTSPPLYLGFDLSTQQLKGIAVGSDLKVVHSAIFDFDKDAKGFPNIKKGVLTNEAEREVFAPVAMWLQAIDTVLQRLHETGIDFARVAGISGAGQQHGSVYWSLDGPSLLRDLDEDHTLEKQLESAFSYPFSPNWQDASTQEQCDMFDQCLGNATELALNTGSKAHHVSWICFIHCRWSVDVDCSVSLGLKFSVSGIKILKSTKTLRGSRWFLLFLHRYSLEILHLLIFRMFAG